MTLPHPFAKSLLWFKSSYKPSSNIVQKTFCDGQMGATKDKPNSDENENTKEEDIDDSPGVNKMEKALSNFDTSQGISCCCSPIFSDCDDEVIVFHRDHQINLRVSKGR